MKKTISINLANRSFYIEEDAYNMLNAYLQGIEMHYKQTDPDGEIVGDIEERLSEIFFGSIRLGHEVITKEITEEAMRQMGPLEDIVDEPVMGATTHTEGEAHFASHETKSEAGSQRRTESATSEAPQRKLYKDPTDKWISGFLGGLAKYLRVDPIFVRIIFILCLFTPINWTLIIVYIACAIFVPTAKTVTQRLEMEGAPINPDSIWKKVKEESVQVAETVNSRLEDLGETFRAKKRPTDSASANGVVTHVAAEAPVTPKKTSKATKALYIVIIIGVVAAIVLGFFWLIGSLSSGDIFNPFYWTSYINAPDNGAELLLIMSIIIIGIVVAFGLFALLIMPLGLILKSNSTPMWKAIGIIGYIILLSFIFAQ